MNRSVPIAKYPVNRRVKGGGGFGAAPVEERDLMVASDERLREMVANEPGATKNGNSHPPRLAQGFCGTMTIQTIELLKSTIMFVVLYYVIANSLDLANRVTTK